MSLAGGEVFWSWHESMLWVHAADILLLPFYLSLLLIFDLFHKLGLIRVHSKKSLIYTLFSRLSGPRRIWAILMELRSLRVKSSSSKARKTSSNWFTNRIHLLDTTILSHFFLPKHRDGIFNVYLLKLLKIQKSRVEPKSLLNRE